MTVDFPEKRTKEEQLKFALENLEDASYSFAVFTDAIKRYFHDHEGGANS